MKIADILDLHYLDENLSNKEKIVNVFLKNLHFTHLPRVWINLKQSTTRQLKSPLL